MTHSFGVVPARPVCFEPSLIEMLRRIVGWLSGRRPSLQQSVLERQVVHALAEEMEAEQDSADLSAPDQKNASADKSAPKASRKAETKRRGKPGGSNGVADAMRQEGNDERAGRTR